MSYEDGAACDAAYLAAAALTHCAVRGSSEHFDPFKGASGELLAEMWTELFTAVDPFMSAAALGGVDSVLTDAMVETGLPGFAQSVLADLAVWRQQQLKQGLTLVNCRRVEAVADVTAGAWLDALPVSSNCLLGDGDVVSSLRYMLGVCPAVMQERPLVCECGKPFSPGQAMRCRCCAGVRTVCHDISVESGWRACVHKSGQSSTREPADSDLQGEVPMDPALVNGRRVDFHVFDLAGSIGADVMITDPTAPSYVERGWDESRLLRECERAKREKHVLNGGTMIPLVMTTFGKLGPSAESYLQSLADVACLRCRSRCPSAWCTRCVDKARRGLL